MSFSSDVKKELNNINSLSNKELVRYELIGYMMTSNMSIIGNKEIKFATESDYNINRFSKLLTNLNIKHNIEIIGKSFVITIKIKNFENKKYKDINLEELNDIKDEEKRAIMRGMFLGSGSINNPENKYHLEIIYSNEENLDIAKILLKQYSLNIKRLITKNKYFIYIKEGEEISKFLALIGASKAVMKFEDIRIKREMRGKVNRLVNCESANLNKVINASIAQIEAIQKLKETGQFNKLSNNLKEIAILRLENPDMSLIELGKLLKEPIGKSGVNYRLKKIIEIARRR